MNYIPFNTTTLDASLKAAWDSLRPLPEGWCLAWGTAVVLYFGHRSSTDLHWYAPDGQVDEDVIAELASFERFCNLGSIKGGGGMVDCVLQPTSTAYLAIEMTFFESFKNFVPKPQHPPRGSTNPAKTPVMHPIDLASCKIQAVMGRGELRDYEDLYILAQRRPDVLREGLLQLHSNEGVDLHRCLMAMVNPGEHTQLPASVARVLTEFVSTFNDEAGSE